MGKPGELDIGDILRAQANGDGPLRIMFAQPGQKPQPTDWRIVLLKVLESIDRNTYETQQALKRMEKGVGNGNSEAQAESIGDGEG